MKPLSRTRSTPAVRVGRPQIIPNRGAHEQIYCTPEQIETLRFFGYIEYEPDYGPNANVYQPVGEADAEKVRSWLA